MAEGLIAVICVVIFVSLLSAAFDSNRFVTRTYEIRSRSAARIFQMRLR